MGSLEKELQGFGMMCKYRGRHVKITHSELTIKPLNINQYMVPVVSR